MCSIYQHFKEKYPQNLDEAFIIDFDCGWGWEALLDKVFKEIQDTDIKIIQVKEKFGGLRIYTNTDKFLSVINSVEIESFKVCEICGNRKTVTTEGSWLKTLCKKCRDKQYEKDYEDKLDSLEEFEK